MAQPGSRTLTRPDGAVGSVVPRMRRPRRGAHAAPVQPRRAVLALLAPGAALALLSLLVPVGTEPLQVASALLIGLAGAVAWWNAPPDPEQPAWLPKGLAVIFLVSLVILAGEARTQVPSGLPGGSVLAAPDLSLLVRSLLMLLSAGMVLWTAPVGLRRRPVNEWVADALLIVLGMAVPLFAVFLPERMAHAPLSLAEWVLVAGIGAISLAAGSVALWPRPPCADPGQAIVVAVGAFGVMALEVVDLAGGWGVLRQPARLNAAIYLCAGLLGVAGIVRTQRPRFESLRLAVTVAFGVMAAVSPWLVPEPNRLWGSLAVAGAAVLLAYRLIRTDIRSERDRTALAEAAAREQEAARRLRALDEMKTTFLRAVSHDLRTPLTVILGSALTLQRNVDDLPPADRAELLGRLGANARKLERLLGDLLDLDRLSRGMLEPERRPTDVGALVSRVAAEMEALADRPVTVHAPPVMADVDAPKVERIVENLLANAARYTPAGTPVWIRVDPRPAGVEIAVEDAGPGLPAERRESIFDAFEQGPGAAADGAGVGIGLSLVIRFAELHGGRAWVQDRAGGGASFRVLLPDDAAAGGAART